jgi:hypothetical protein
MTPAISTTAHAAFNRTLLPLAAILTIAFGFMAPANADNIYSFETLSATMDGTPTNSLAAFGQIIISSAAVAAGHASVTTSNPAQGTPVETLDGVTSAYLDFTLGPQIATPYGVINFTASLSGEDIHITPQNLYGGFFVNGVDSDAYYAVGSSGSDILTIGYGTDDAGSPCYGPQMPGVSKCVVTGEFVYAGDPPPAGAAPVAVPEPGSFPILLGGLSLLGALLMRQRRQLRI